MRKVLTPVYDGLQKILEMHKFTAGHTAPKGRPPYPACGGSLASTMRTHRLAPIGSRSSLKS